MNADDIYAALQRRHQMPEWVLIRELRLGTGLGGYRDPTYDKARKRWHFHTVAQRIDAWALNCYAGNGFKKIAYEIKVTHADFIREKLNPDKRKGAMEVSDYFYFAAPRGVIAPMELPKDTGLLVVYESGRTQILERAPRLPASRLDWLFIASLMRNTMQMRRKDLTKDRFAEERA